MDHSTKYRMRIAYDGTCYSGWQVQPNSTSIQGVIERALHILLKRHVRVVGAGRTDAGVHALGQSAHFSTDTPCDCGLILHALNGMLPPDIRIKELIPALQTFHAQYSAISKIYHYHLWLEKTVDPMYRLYRNHFPNSHFSLQALQQSAIHFVGRHDFATFANSGNGVVSTVRTLMRLDIMEQEGGVRLEFEGDGFLYKMVRNIVGTLLQAATRKCTPEHIPLLLTAKDRRIAGPAAPAKGLFLMAINYPSCFSNISKKVSKCEKVRPIVLTN